MLASPPPRGRFAALHRKALADRAEARARAAHAAQARVLAAATPRLAKQVSRAFLSLEASAVHGPEVEAKAQASEKIYPLTYTVPDWNAFERTMGKLLTTEYVSVGNLALGDVERQLGITIDFELNERIIPKGVIARKITQVTDTTKRAVNELIRQGIDDGVHPSVIAKRMRDQLRGYAGFEDLTKSRAYTIARTETAFAYNLGAVQGFRQSGLVRQVRVIDSPTCGWRSHNDPDTANGKIVTLDQAAAVPISHPNCVRAFAPVAAGLEENIAPPEEDLYANPKSFIGRHGIGTSDAELWGHELWDALPKPIPREWTDALYQYSGSGYTFMNGHLRGQYPSIGRDQLDRLRALEAYIAKGATPDAAVVYRGVGSGRAFGFTYEMYGDQKVAHANSLVGQAFNEVGFMSTALHEDAAFSGVRLQLTVPKGYPALPVSNEATGAVGTYTTPTAAKIMAEAELLLQPGAKYVIDAVRVADDYGDKKITLIGHVLPR